MQVRVHYQELIIEVLISTYWNVNKDVFDTLQNFLLVLISTYWNVNNAKLLLSLKNAFCFNLNLLECK